MDYVNHEHRKFIEQVDEIARQHNISIGYKDYEGNVYHYDWAEETPHKDFSAKRELIYRLSHAHKEVLEIGLNVGHSASILLFGNPNIKVHAIDIEYHGYTKHCAEVLKQHFPDRFFYWKGDSKELLFQNRETFQSCDLVIIDGDHSAPGFEYDLTCTMALAGHRKILIDDANFTDIKYVLDKHFSNGAIRVVETPNFKYEDYHMVIEKC